MTPPGIFPSTTGDVVIMPISIGEWLLNYYNPQQTQACSNSLECTVEAGDVVFVPHGWWHAVINLDEGINVAITHNYVSKSNLPTVLQFLDCKQDQISGCRDRKESIKPEFLLQAFEQGLEKNGMSHLLQEAKQVVSLRQGWSGCCQAWTDKDNNDDDDHVDKPKKLTKKRKRQQQDRRRTTVLGTTTTSIMAKAKQNLPASNNHPQEPFCFSFL